MCLVICLPNFYARISRIKLSKDGPEVSRIAYGTLHLNEANSAKDALIRIQAAFDAGITTFDLSDVYGGGKCMQLFGKAINMVPGFRKKIEIIAKMDCASDGYDTSTEHLTSVLNQYLNVLNTDYIDLVLLHRQDYLLDVDGVGTLFTQWKSQGLVHYFGTSNFDENAFLNLASRVPLVTNEIEVSAWAPETIAPLGAGPISPDKYLTNNGLVDFHYRHNQSVLAWGPTGGDPYDSTPNRLFGMSGDRQTKILYALQQVSQSISNNTIQCKEDCVAVAWILKHPARIVPILGTMNLTRINEQSQFAEEAANKMTRSQWYDIARASGLPLP